MYKLVVFDLDGTLVNSLADLAISVNKALRASGLEEQPLLRYNKFVGNGVDVLIKRAMGGKCDDTRLFSAVKTIFSAEYAEHCNDNTTEYEGCSALLESLCKNGIKTAVLSNKPDEFVGKILKKVYPHHSFAEAWGQKPEFKRKPDGGALLKMLEIHGIEKAQCLYVGDSDVDVFTAKNAGVDMAGVEWGFRGRQELSDAGAGFVAANTDELLKFILEKK